MNALIRMDVTQTAVIARIKRSLAHDCLYLHRSRAGSRAEQSLGEFYITDDRNNVTVMYCDLEPLARSLGVLDEAETIA